MSDKKTVLIVDDAGRFENQSLFEPEFYVHHEPGGKQAAAYLSEHPGVAVTLINLENDPAEDMTLLAFIRAKKSMDAMVVWVCLDPCDEPKIRRSYEDGADELIYRLPCNVSLQYQIRRFKAFPIRYEGRDTPVFLAGVSDVPSRYRVEQVLQESNQKLEAIMNAVPGGIAMYDLGGKLRLLYSNDVLPLMCGYDTAAYKTIMEEDYHALIDPQDRQLVDSFISTFRSKPQRLEGAFRIRTKENGTRWVRVSATPVGNGPECSAVFIDVTRDKENEFRNERMRSELYYRAENDTLTGLNNRETFYRKTAELLHANPGTAYVILMMDIDRFKVINDMFGKEVGDRILVAIGEGLKNLLKDVGTCARMESDHFASCFPQQLLDMDRIMALFDEGLQRQKVAFHLQVSYGIYQIRNINIPVNHMCDRAVMALKTIKGNVLTRYAFYDDKLRQALLEENGILDQMNSALEQGQFVPFLQPVFTVDSRKPVSVEILVRWQHPEKGLIPPGQFIPLFERNGFITRLDMYIWEQACKLLKRWEAENHPLPVSVNISRIDLYYPRLCEHLLGLTKRYGVDPSMLQLEITESAYSKDPDGLVQIINRLRASGFLVLMDDFGSGYSSLNVLMDMPVDVLKLDSRFLSQIKTNPRAASILTSIVRMAKWLNMPVVSEGVETVEQLTFLRSIGCDHVQGYLLARPMDVDSYTRRFVKTKLEPLTLPPAARQDTVDLSALWDASARADALFNGMIGGLGIYELSGDTLEIRRVNDGYYELFGSTPKQVFESAREVLAAVHPEDRAGLLQACRDASKSGRVEHFVCRHLHYGAGKEIWLETRIRFLGKTGLNDVFCFVFNDVTEQKEFERARTLRNYAMVLSSVYSEVFELNLTAKRVRSIHSESGGDIADTEERPWKHLKDYLYQILFKRDAELEKSIFTEGYLSGKLAENQGGYYSVERRVKDATGASRWASFTFIRLSSDTAKEVYLLCIADVDSRKRAEVLLLENRWLQLKQQEQARYQQLMEHLGTSLMEWEVDTGRVNASPGFNRYAISAYDFKTLRSHKDIEPYIYPKDHNLFWLLVSDLLAHGSGSVTLRLLETDGTPVWCRILCSVVRDGHTHTTRCLIAFSQVDEQMKIRENYLDEQSRFQAFAENFLVGLGIFEMRGDHQRILYLSGGYRKMIGYSEGERFYDELNTFSGVHPEDVPRFVAATRKLQETGQPYTIDYRVFDKNGNVLWMRSLNSIYPGPEPGVDRIFAVIEDISELKTVKRQMDLLLTGLPMGLGIYGIGTGTEVRYENPRMRELFGGTAPDEGRNPTAPEETEADTACPVIRTRAQMMERLSRLNDLGQTESDETLALFIENGRPVRMRILSAMSLWDGKAECYCALIPAEPAS